MPNWVLWDTSLLNFVYLGDVGYALPKSPRNSRYWCKEVSALIVSAQVVDLVVIDYDSFPAMLPLHELGGLRCVEPCPDGVLVLVFDVLRLQHSLSIRALEASRALLPQAG